MTSQDTPTIVLQSLAATPACRRRSSRARIAAACAAALLSPAAQAQQWVGFDFSSPDFQGMQMTPFTVAPNINPLPASPGEQPWQGIFTTGGNYRFELSTVVGPGTWLTTQSAAFGTNELVLGHDAGPYPYYRASHIKFDWSAPQTRFGTVPTLKVLMSGDSFAQTGTCNAQGRCSGSFDAAVDDVAGRIWTEQFFDNPDMGGARVNYGFFSVNNLQYLLVPTAIPEPQTAALMGLGLLGLGWRQRKALGASGLHPPYAKRPNKPRTDRKAWAIALASAMFAIPMTASAGDPVIVVIEDFAFNDSSNDVYIHKVQPGGGSRRDLTAGNSVQLNWDLNQPITMRDRGLASDESIHIVLEKLDITGTSMVDPGTRIDYELTLTGATGEFTNLSFSGTLPGPNSGGAIDLNRAVEVTNGTMSFQDMHLKLSVVTGTLHYIGIGFGVDADKLSTSPDFILAMPEPGTAPLALAGLGLLVGSQTWRSRRRR